MRRLLTVLAIPALVLLVLLAACGSDDDGTPLVAGDEDRTIQIEMRDIAFAPSAIDVRRGEKIRFVFTNTGQVAHDAVIGDAAAQDEHEKEMHGGQGGRGGHAAGTNAVTVKPGKEEQLTYTFDQPGQLLIGCHQPGHYSGGMKVTVNVA